MSQDLCSESNSALNVFINKEGKRGSIKIKTILLFFSVAFRFFPINQRSKGDVCTYVFVYIDIYNIHTLS